MLEGSPVSFIDGAWSKGLAAQLRNHTYNSSNITMVQIINKRPDFSPRYLRIGARKCKTIPETEVSPERENGNKSHSNGASKLKVQREKPCRKENWLPPSTPAVTHCRIRM